MRWICVAVMLCISTAAHDAAADELPPPETRGGSTTPTALEGTYAGEAYATEPYLGGTSSPVLRPTDPVLPPKNPMLRPKRCRDPYHPSVPMGETRSAWTAAGVSPTPFALTAGEGMTPLRGRLALNLTRISDERFMTDGSGRRWDSDGEVRLISFEVVGPRQVLRLGSLQIPVHASASLHAYTLNHALFDGLRNWVEEDLLGAGTQILDNHDIGGRELAIDGESLLGSSPLWKVRLGAKFPLRKGCILGKPLFSALSLGLTTPSFGSHKASGNEDLQPDITWAYTMPLSRRLWLTGAATVSAPGSTERFDELGIETEDVLFGWNGNLEYWFTPCFAFAAGFQFQTSYLSGTQISMDEWSTYFNLAFLWRPHPRHTLHLTWSENPQTDIPFGLERDFDGSQRDSDFTFLFGWRYSL